MENVEKSQKKDEVKDWLIDRQNSKKNELKKQGFKGEFLDRKNLLDLNILVFIDVSGSITARQFAKFMAQLDAIKGLSRVKVIETDERIVAMYDYYKTKQSKVVRLRGGGGTAFGPAFAAAKRISPDAILFMTDGAVSDYVSDPKIPTAWILTDDGQQPYPWGTVISKI